MNLQSEHVIPLRTISLLFEKVADAFPINRTEADEDRHHTILIYEGAAHRKTHGSVGADNVLKNSLIRIAESGMAKLDGGGRYARSVAARTTAEQRDEIRAKQNSQADRVRAAFAEKLPAIMAAYVAKTTSAVVADHSEDKHDVRGHSEALPTEAKIQTAAALQSQDVAAILAERIAAGG